MRLRSISVIVAYPRVAIPVAVAIVIIVVTIGDNRTKDEWSKVTEMTEASIVESKIVDAGTTKTANTAPRDAHVTNSAAVHASD